MITLLKTVETLERQSRFDKDFLFRSASKERLSFEAMIIDLELEEGQRREGEQEEGKRGNFVRRGRDERFQG